MEQGLTEFIWHDSKQCQFIWHDSKQCQDHASMAMNLHVPINTVNFLTSPTTVGFSRGTLLHGVGWSFISVSQYNTAIRHAKLCRRTYCKETTKIFLYAHNCKTMVLACLRNSCISTACVPSV
jgi:hypothetical protein